MSLTSSCLWNEIDASSDDSGDDNNNGTSTQVITQYVVQTVYLDSDFKTKYDVAVAVFTVFFVILLGLAGYLIYAFIKNRKILLKEV